MQRGTRVGQAYIAVTADGDGINREITDAFDDVDYDSFGQKFGDKFGESIRAHLRSVDSEFSKSLDRMGDAIESDNQITKGIQHQIANAFDLGALDPIIKEVSERAGVKFGDGFDREVNKAVLDSVEDALQKAARSGNIDMSRMVTGPTLGGGTVDLPGPVLDKAVADVRKVVATQRREYEGLWESLLRGQEKSEAERADQVRLGEQITSKIRMDYQKSWEKMLDARDKEVAASEKEHVRQVRLGEQIAGKIRGDYSKMWENLLAKREKEEIAYTRFLGAEERARLKEAADAAARTMREQEKTAKQVEKHAKDYTAFWSSALKAREDDEQRLGRMQELAQKMNIKFDNQRITSLQQLGRMQEMALRMNEKYQKGLLDGQGQSVSRNQSKSLSDTIGRLFGAGSRNNGLNLLGKTMGNVVGLVEKGNTLVTTFAKGFSSAAEGAGLVARAMSGFAALGGSGAGFAGMFASLAASAPLVAVALGAVLIVGSALVSVLGALLGIVVALASTIASALVGALAVAGPLLASFVAGAALVTAAFTSMTEAQRTYLASAFQPVKAAFTGIGQIIFTQFTKPLYDGQSAIQVWATNIQKAMVPLSGVARSTAGAFADAGISITGALSGPGFQKLYASLETELPSIVRNLSSAFADFADGIGATFAAIMPQVTRFTQYLSDGAREFSKWANSAKGQNAIKDFVDRAVDSLKSLWGFIKEVGGLLADVFFGKDAQNAGNSIFDSMRTEVEKFRTKLEGMDLKGWFEDARKFGRRLYNGIVDLSDVITDLYDDGTLDKVGDSFETMAEAVKDVSEAVKKAKALFSIDLPDSLDALVNPIGSAIGLIDNLSQAIRDIPSMPSLSLPKLPSIPGGSSLGGAVTESIIGAVTGERVASMGRKAGETFGRAFGKYAKPDLDALIDSGNDALDNTYTQNGGYMDDPKGGKGGGKGGTPNPQDGSNVGEPGGKGGKGGKGRNKKFEQGWQNPYLVFAQGLIMQGMKLADEIRAAAATARDELDKALTDAFDALSEILTGTGQTFMASVLEASNSFDPSSVIDSFNSMVDSASQSAMEAVANAQTQATAMVDSAVQARAQMIASGEAAVQAAAQAIASAATPRELKNALAQMDQARRDLDLAYATGDQIVREAQANAQRLLDTANATQTQINAANAIIAGQAILNTGNVLALISGQNNVNATLADYAEARRIVAERMAEANQKLSDAIGMRDSYNSQVAESIRSFGSILSAQAKSINGIAQALTADDISGELRSRLARIKTFRDNLRQLLASGLSDDAYKQLVDAGVEGAGEYVQAIVNGGQGAVSEVNDLIGQISNEADLLGEEASTRLYQAGVDAAQSLLDGLTSLSGELAAAAGELGYQIAVAIARTLGLPLPDRADYTAATGSGNGTRQMAASVPYSTPPGADGSRGYSGGVPGARPASESPVSGNTGKVVNVGGVTIVTPTKDPKAVANEAINEIVGNI